MGSKLSTTFWSINSSTPRPTTKKSLQVEESNQEEVVYDRDSGRGESTKKKSRRRKKRQKSKRKDKICVQEMNDDTSENNLCSAKFPESLHMCEDIKTTKVGIAKQDVVEGAKSLQVPCDDESNSFKEVKSRRGSKYSPRSLKKSDNSNSSNRLSKNIKVPSPIIPSLIHESLLRSVRTGATSSNSLLESSSCVPVTIAPVPHQSDGSRNQTETLVVETNGENTSSGPGTFSEFIDPVTKKDQEKKVLIRAAEQASPYVNNSTCEEKQRGNKKLRTASNPPQSRLYNGVKVTMIDEARKIFIIDLLNEKTCMLIRNIAEEYIEHLEKNKAKCRSRNGDITKGWRTLYTYTKMDLPCSEIKSVENITNRIMDSVVKIVGEVYGKKIEASNLRPRSWKEPHLLKYQKYDGVMPHTGVEMHYDGCDITWQAMLTRSDEYEGGGTYIRCIRKNVKLQLGQVLVHPGELYHKGVDITHGTRFLLVCFMDGFDPKIADNSVPNEHSEEYEKDVIMV